MSPSNYLLNHIATQPIIAKTAAIIADAGKVTACATKNIATAVQSNFPPILHHLISIKYYNTSVKVPPRRLELLRPFGHEFLKLTWLPLQQRGIGASSQIRTDMALRP
jgi:hypothetical protein